MEQIKTCNLLRFTLSFHFWSFSKLTWFEFCSWYFPFHNRCKMCMCPARWTVITPILYYSLISILSSTFSTSPLL